MQNNAKQETINEIEQLMSGKVFLTLEDITKLLGCDPEVIYNWCKRADSKKRPPRLIVGKDIRFPKKEFVRWLMTEQLAQGG